MSDTTLKMIDMASSHSARMFSQIDNAMTRNMNLQLQLQQQETQTFFKAAQFGEQVRMNDNAIKESVANNKIRAMEYELQSEIMPLKIESMKLRLERDRLVFNKESESFNKGLFNEIAAPVNKWIAEEFLRTEDVEALNNYGMLQSRTIQGISRDGLQVDINQYERQAKDGITFLQQDSDHVYDPVVSRNLQDIDPNSHKIYEHKYNPVYKRQASAHASSFIISRNPKDLEAFSLLAPEEDIGKVVSASAKYDENQKRIDMLYKDFDRVNTELAKLEATGKKQGDSAYDTAANRINTIAKEIEEKSSYNTRILNGVTTGSYNIEDTFTPRVEVPDIAIPTADPSLYEERRVETVSGLAPYSEDSLTGMVKNVENLYAGIIPGYKEDSENRLSLIDRSVFADIDLSIYEDGSTRFNSNEISKVQKQVLSNIREKKQMPSDQRVMALAPFVTKPVKVPLSKAALKILNPPIDPMRTYGYTAPQKAYVVITGSYDKGFFDEVSHGAISTNEDILKLTRNIRNKEERELVRQEIFAAYHTAAIGNTLK